MKSVISVVTRDKNTAPAIGNWAENYIEEAMIKCFKTQEEKKSEQKTIWRSIDETVSNGAAIWQVLFV